MKKVLFIIYSLHIGGAEKVLCDFLDKFDYTKYEVDLLLYIKAGPLLSSVNNNVRIRYIYKKHGSIVNCVVKKVFRVIGCIDWYEKRIADKVCYKKYDSIISFCQGPAHKLHTLLLNKSRNNISWIHSDLSVSNWGIICFNNDLSKQEVAYNMMNKLVFVSNDAKLAFNRIFKVKESIQQHIVYNFVNVENVANLSKKPINNIKTDFTFINIGRLIDAKRHDRLVEAAKILKNNGYKFKVWIIGDGPLRDSLELKIHEESMEDVVLMLGMHKNPYPFLHYADCFVLTSQQEGFPIVIGEAFALSKPVISTKITGPSEILEDNKYGIVVEQDVQQIADAMKQMLKEDDIRKYYSAKGHERLSFFDPDKIIKQIYSIL